MEPIGETLKKITNATSKANMATSANTKKESKKEVCKICGGFGWLRYVVPDDDPNFGKSYLCECKRKEIQEKEIIESRKHRDLFALNDKTFDSFNIKGRGEESVRKDSLEVAFNAAYTYSHKLDGWLLIKGGYGTGKTHLAAAIANEALSFGIQQIFITVPDLLDWIRYGFNSEMGSFEQRFEEIKSTKLLILDDLGTENETEWAVEKLFQVLNHRYVHKLATVITTNRDFSQLDERIGSRLHDRNLVTTLEIDADDFRNPLAEGQETTSYAVSKFSEHRTLQTFEMRKSERLSKDQEENLEKALSIAGKYAENPKGWLIFMGGYGTGKTHLAAGIAYFRTMMKETPVFTVVPDLLDHLRSTFSPESSVSYDKVFNQVRNAKLLILDDLGTQNATPWAREKLFQILNHRYESNLSTVITTSNTLDEMDPRIRSRILDERICKVFKMTIPPYKARSDKRKKSVN